MPKSQGFRRFHHGSLTVRIGRLITTIMAIGATASSRRRAHIRLLSAPDNVREHRRWKSPCTERYMKRHLLAAALLMVTGTGTALAADPMGTWLTQGGNSRIRIADCGGALCGTI